MAKKSIYIAYTGGTIGMTRSKQGYVPESGFLQQCLENMPEFQRAEMPSFHIHEYHPLIDSSDMTPADWQQIADDIQRNYDKFDGFVVLHGTDTMAFTASALSFMLEGLGKPVVVTGSQIPLAELRTDGRDNLLNALYLASQYPIPEVTLFFNNKLFRGNRTTKAHADGFDAFCSPNFPELLDVGINVDIVAGKLSFDTKSNLQVHRITPQPVGVVTLYPGIAPEVIANMLRQPVKALLLLSYGVGNAPQNREMLAILEEAKQREIVVVNCSQCLRGSVNMSGYATGKALEKAGVISGYDMTTEATLTKLHFLLCQNLTYQQICDAMQQPLREELSTAG